MSGDAADDAPGRQGVSWGELAREEPELAAAVRARFEAHSQHVLATLTVIGSPRVSGTRVGWWRDELWIGAPTGSRRTRDLRSDARFALHSNPGDGSGGDAKIGGLAVELVPGPLLDDLLAESAISEPLEVFVLRVRSVRLSVPAQAGGPAGVRRWRPGAAGHTH